MKEMEQKEWFKKFQEKKLLRRQQMKEKQQKLKNMIGQSQSQKVLSPNEVDLSESLENKDLEHLINSQQQLLWRSSNISDKPTSNQQSNRVQFGYFSQSSNPEILRSRDPLSNSKGFQLKTLKQAKPNPLKKLNTKRMSYSQSIKPPPLKIFSATSHLNHSAYPPDS